jgi:hypothetical protein
MLKLVRIFCIVTGVFDIHDVFGDVPTPIFNSFVSIVTTDYFNCVFCRRIQKRLNVRLRQPLGLVVSILHVKLAI